MCRGVFYFSILFFFLSSRRRFSFFLSQFMSKVELIDLIDWIRFDYGEKGGRSIKSLRVFYKNIHNTLVHRA